MAAASSLQPRRGARRTQFRKGGIERHDFDAELVPHAQRTPMHRHGPDDLTNLGLRGPRWRQQPLRTKLLRQQPNCVCMDEERREGERKGGREGVGGGRRTHLHRGTSILAIARLPHFPKRKQGICLRSARRLGYRTPLCTLQEVGYTVDNKILVGHFGKYWYRNLHAPHREPSCVRAELHLCVCARGGAGGRSKSRVIARRREQLKQTLITTT